MEITFIEYTEEEVQEKSDQIQKDEGAKPTEVQLIIALQEATMSEFPNLQVMRIAQAKNPYMLIFALIPI